MELFIVCLAGFMVGWLISHVTHRKYDPQETLGTVFVIDIEGERPYLYLELYGEVEDLYDLSTGVFDISHR